MSTREKGLYRGKRVYNNKDWAYGYYSYCEYLNEHQISENGCSYSVVNPETVGQYTGECYEDDIFAITDTYNDVETIAVCKYIPAIYPAFDLYVKSDNKIGWSTYSDEYNAFTMDGIIYEKIGNIHDNPELLENIE